MLDWGSFFLDGGMGKDSVIESVSTIISLTPILGWDLVDREEMSQQSAIWNLLLASITMEELW